VTVEYVLPLRWQTADPAALAELTTYLTWLSGQVRVTVVDGSPPAVRALHTAAWAALPLVHLEVDADLRDCEMGKVAGVLTALRRPGPDRVVIADDDVRWTRPGLLAAVALLDRADVVRPQNYFDPLPWHARWDTGRTLLNRAVAADWPGTLVLRRRALPAGYDGDAMFENLELVRTVQAAGGRELPARGLFVRRLPPTAAHFRGQRVRQAYDSVAQPGRLVAELAVLPAALLAARRRPRLLLAGLAAVIGLAEAGRRRAGGRAVFHPGAPLWAPLWLAERAVCSWLALGARLRGGVRYGDHRLALAAHSRRALRAAYREGRLGHPALIRGRRRPEAGDLVGAVAEGLAGGLAAPAQRDGLAPRVDDVAVLGPEGDRPAHQQRSVLVRGDGDLV
jgi:hypothetical protein